MPEPFGNLRIRETSLDGSHLGTVWAVPGCPTGRRSRRRLFAKFAFRFAPGFNCKN